MLKRALAAKFQDEIKFLKGWKSNMKAVGAIAPTSATTARKMASVIDMSSGLPVLELGAGTGVITKAILAQGVADHQLVSVEFDLNFYSHLQSRFPNVDVKHGDAFNLGTTLGDRRDDVFDCVISAIPLLSFDMTTRVALIEDLLKRVPRGRPVVQITYGPVSPVTAMPERYATSHLGFVLRNIPPAQLWTYRRK